MKEVGPEVQRFMREAERLFGFAQQKSVTHCRTTQPNSALRSLRCAVGSRQPSQIASFSEQSCLLASNYVRSALVAALSRFADRLSRPVASVYPSPRVSLF